jgi:glycosyltransferase involved in cell wall biosynthesis
MIVHSYCPADPRVRREAEALAAAGHRVDVLCLRDAGQSRRETVAGVRYLRLPLRRRRGGVLRYAWEYLALLALGLVAASALHARHRYRLVQVHNMPDLLVFCGLVPWLTGVPVLLDLHDPVPELFMSKFGLGAGAPLIRALTRLEGIAVRFADHTLVATGAFRDRLLERGRPAAHLTVLLNAPDPRIFRPGEDPPGNGTPCVLFHGTVTHRSGVDRLVRAAERVRTDGVPLRLVILGDGDLLPRVRELVAEGDRAAWVEIRGAVPLENVPAAVAAADLGVVPNRSGPFTELALPTRLFEYLTLGRAVVVSRARAIAHLFAEEDLLFCDPEDDDDLARVLAAALRDPEARRRCVERGGRVAHAHRWEREKEIYLDVVGSLVAAAAGDGASAGARSR